MAQTAVHQQSHCFPIERALEQCRPAKWLVWYVCSCLGGPECVHNMCTWLPLNVCICLYLLVFVFVSKFVDNTVGHQGGIALNVRKQLI